MLIDDFNQIIEDKVDEIQLNVKLDLRKDINKDRYYHRDLFLKLMNFKYRTLLIDTLRVMSGLIKNTLK